MKYYFKKIAFKVLFPPLNHVISHFQSLYDNWVFEVGKAIFIRRRYGGIVIVMVISFKTKVIKAASVNLAMITAEMIYGFSSIKIYQ